jgi:hypothetical protein
VVDRQTASRPPSRRQIVPGPAPHGAVRDDFSLDKRVSGDVRRGDDLVVGHRLTVGGRRSSSFGDALHRGRRPGQLAPCGYHDGLPEPSQVREQWSSHRWKKARNIGELGLLAAAAVRSRRLHQARAECQGRLRPPRGPSALVRNDDAPPRTSRLRLLFARLVDQSLASAAAHLLGAFEFVDEGFDRDCGERRDLDRSPRAEIHGEMRDGLVVGCFHDGEEVVGA